MKRLIISLFALSVAQFAMSQNGEVREFTANGVKFEMVCVDGGTFDMGEPGKAESTTVGSFLIGKTEVTQDLWKAVMGKNPSSLSGRGKGLPVESVSWNDCKAFVEKLNQLTGQKFRLPTEEEWEYAARGGSKSGNFKFSGGDVIGKVGWYSKNSDSHAHPVATKAPNELGIYDMSGNLWEWCADAYEGVESLQYVIRGGCFTDTSQACWVWNRSKNAPTAQNGICGVRLAMDK
ncbi:MAG: formylglycine-generating enzyme family protein [Salinivirgaceae bacterium]|nr:formylglycine-generating enzyme family protein [Salinivirgaceae bacterium]